jgi:hypothetical protein
MSYSVKVWFMFLTSLFMLLLGCSEISPTNPYDPRAPRTVQALGSLSGRAVNADTALVVDEVRARLYEGDGFLEGACQTDEVGSEEGMPDAGMNATTVRAVAEATSNAQGVFQLNGLNEGVYTLCLSHARYEGLRRTAIRVGIGEVVLLGDDLQLRPGKGTVVAQLDLGDLELSSERGQRVLRETVVTLSPIGEASGNASLGAPDVDGKMTFSGVALGRWRLQFSHPDYLPIIEEFELSSIDEVVEVRGLLPIELEVNPGGVLGTIRLEEPGSNSMDGIIVTVFNDQDVEVSVEVTLERQFDAANYGAFSIDGSALRAGFYRLEITHQTFEYQSKTISPLEIRAGETTEVAVIDVSYARGDVTGTISTSDGLGEARALVELTGSVSLSMQVDDSGAYRFEDIRGGTYDLRASLNGYFDVVTNDVVVQQDQVTVVESMVLQVDPGSISGIVVDEDSQPLENVQVSIEDGVSVFTGVSGNFRIDGLRSGTYTLNFVKTDFVQSAVVNQAVQPGAATDIGTLTLSHARNQITGTIRTVDDASPAGAVVRLVDGPTARGLIVGDDGEFVFDEVRVGQYGVSVSLADYRSQMVTGVVLTATDVRQVGTVELAIAAGDFNGTVVDEVGHALEGVLVGIEGGQTTSTTQDGQFTVSGLKAGPYGLTLSKDGYVDQSISNQMMIADGTIDLGTQVLAYRRGVILGSVSTEDDVSVDGALIQLEDGPSNGGTVIGADGSFRFEGIREGDYSVRASLTDYQAVLKTGITVSADQDANAGNLELLIAPGSVSGTVVDEHGNGIVGVAVNLLREAEVTATTSLEDGSFSISDLRAGIYQLTASVDGHVATAIEGVSVYANSQTTTGTMVLDFERGHLEGMVTLEDNGALSAVVIVAVSNSDGETYVSSALTDGSWSIRDIRTGSYTVTASASDYVSENDTVLIAANETTLWSPSLSIDYGCLSGSLELSDGAPTITDVELSIVETGVQLNAPNGEGQFTIDSLAPGQHTLKAELDGYQSVERIFIVRPGVSCQENVLVGTMVLRDLMSPDAVSLSIKYPTYAPLPGFEDTISFIPIVRYARAAGVLTPAENGGYHGFTLSLDAESSLNPLADLNFDPDNGIGYWKISTLIDGQQRTFSITSADLFRSEPPAQLDDSLCFGDEPDASDYKHCISAIENNGDYEFTFLFRKEPDAGEATYIEPQRAPLLNETMPIMIAAVDAEGNEGEADQIFVNLDTYEPRPEPEDGIVLFVPDAHCEPSALEGVQRCFTDKTSVTINIAGDGFYDVKLNAAGGEQPNFGNFGCTYLLTHALNEQVDLGEWSMTGLSQCVHWDESAPLQSCQQMALILDSEVCYGAGKPVVSVIPTTSRTLYCLRGVDRAGQMSAVGCVELISDDTPPTVFDVYPTDVAVKGPFATLYLTNGAGTVPSDFPGNLDTNFSGFEVKSDATGLQPVSAECVDDQCTQIRVPLLPGQTNTFEITAIDASGNRSDDVIVTLHENGTQGVGSDLGAPGNSPSLFGSVNAWAEAGNCEPNGVNGELYGRGCMHQLQYMNEAISADTVLNLSIVPWFSPDTFTQFGDYALNSTEPGDLQTCLVACPADSTDLGFGTGTQTPLVRLAPTGIYAATYLEGNPVATPYGPEAKSHRLYYRSFGGDGVPDFNLSDAAGDDCTAEIKDGFSHGTIIALEGNRKVLAYLRQDSEQGYHLFMRSQFKALPEDSSTVSDECEEGVALGWQRIELTDLGIPVKLGVIDDAVYLITLNNEVILFSLVSNKQGESIGAWKMQSFDFMDPAEDAEGAQYQIDAGAFSKTELHIAVSRSNATQKLYSLKHFGIHQFDVRQDLPAIKEGECDCEAEQACFERFEVETSTETVTQSLCSFRANHEGLLAAYSYDTDTPCHPDTDPCVAPDTVCLGLPGETSDDPWQGYCIKTCDTKSDCVDPTNGPSTYQCRAESSDYLSTLTLAADAHAHICLNLKPNLETSNGFQNPADCDWCGEVSELSIDDNTMVWTALQDVGYETHSLVSAKISEDSDASLIPRALVQPQAAPLSQMVIVGSRVTYLDENSGLSRVRAADVNQQNWTGLSYEDRHRKQDLRANTELLLYGSFSEDGQDLSGTDGLYLVPTQSDRSAVKVGVCGEGEEDCGLYDVFLPEGAPNNCGLKNSTKQVEWQSGTGFDLELGTAVLFARAGQGCPDDSYIFSATRPAPELLQSSLLDPWLSLVPEPKPVTWNGDLSSSRFHVRAGLRGQVLYAREGPRLSAAQLNGLGESSCGGGMWTRYGIKLTDPTFGPQVIDLTAALHNPVIETLPDVELSNIDCNVLDLAVNYADEEVHVVCAGFPVGCDPRSSRIIDKMEQRIEYFSFRFAGGEFLLRERVDLVSVVNPMKTDTDISNCDVNSETDAEGENLSRCGVLRLLKKGVISSATVNVNGSIALELSDGDIGTIALIEKGADGIWGHQADATPNNGESSVVNDDEVSIIYTRLGEDLGGLALGRDALVFADQRNTNQPEIMRLSLGNGSIQRLTESDRRQTHPAITDEGVYFVDDRYSDTAGGNPLVMPGITRQQISSVCDADYNKCPSGFSCIGNSFRASCLVSAKSDLLACDPQDLTVGCPNGSVCTSYPGSECLGLDLSGAQACLVCVDDSN